MIVGQMDEIISKALLEKHLSHNSQNFGISNGVLLESKNTGDKMVYINSFVEDKILKFELCIIQLQYEQSTKPVHYIPLTYSGEIGRIKLESAKHIKAVKIQMNPYNLDPKIIAVKISTWRNIDSYSSFESNQERTDTLSTLVLDELQISAILDAVQKRVDKPSSQYNPYITLIEIQFSQPNIILNEYKWYPFGKFMLVTLLNNDMLEVWDITKITIPVFRINLKTAKKSKNPFPKSSFTTFEFFNNPNNSNAISYNQHSLFLMNNCGELYSIFPFIIEGTEMPLNQYQQIVENYDEQEMSDQHNVLFQYIKKCRVSIEDKVVQFVGTDIKNSHLLYLQYWNCHPSRSNLKLADLQKFSLTYRYSNLQLRPITNDCTLIIAIREIKGSQEIVINIGMITHQLKLDDNTQIQNEDTTLNLFNWIAQLEMMIRSSNPQIVKLLTDKLKNRAIKDSKSKKIDEQLHFWNGRSLQRIDFSQFFRFAQTNNLQQISSTDPFPIITLFQIPQNQEVVSFCLNYSQNNMYLVRKTAYNQNQKNEKIKFQIHAIDYINLFNELDVIDQYSKKLTNRLKSMMTSYFKEQQGPAYRELSRPKTNQKQLSEYIDKGNRGVDQFKKDYQKYCCELKNKIDGHMNSVKKQYELLQSQVSKFQSLGHKKKNLQNLLKQVQENKQKIAAKLLKPTNARLNQVNSEQIVEYNDKIEMVKSMLESLQSKKIEVDKNLVKKMSEQANILIEKLQKLKKDTQEIKQMKKKIQILEAK